MEIKEKILLIQENIVEPEQMQSIMKTLDVSHIVITNKEQQPDNHQRFIDSLTDNQEVFVLKKL